MALYNKRGTAPSVDTNLKQIDATKGVDALQQKYERVAQQNFALGSALLIDDLFRTSYKNNKTNTGGFLKSIDDGLKEGSKSLPDEIKNKLFANVELKKAGYLEKIEQNLIKFQDDNLKKQTNDWLMRSKENEISNADTLLNAIYYNKNGENKKGVEQAKKDFYSWRGKQIEVAGAKTVDGLPVVSESKLKELQEFDSITRSFETMVNGLGYDEASDFYKNNFKDRISFTNATGVDDRTYDKMDKWYQSKLKQNEKDEEADIKSSAEISGVMALGSLNEEEQSAFLNNPNVSDDFKDSYKGIMKTLQDESSSYQDTRDTLNVLDKFVPLALSFSNKDGKFDRTKIMNNFNKEFKKYSISSKASDEDKREVVSIFKKAIEDERFGGYISNMLDGDDSFIGVPLIGRGRTEQNRNFQRSGGNDRKEKAYNDADILIQQGLSLELSLAADGREDEALQVRESTKKAVADARASWVIDTSTLNDFDNKLKNGEKPIFNFHGVYYNYIGRDENYNPIFERKNNGK